MKKLMLAVAVACTAGLVQAAAVTWSVTNVQNPNGGIASAGWLVQVFDAANAFDIDAVKAGTLTAEFSSYTAAVGTTTVMKAGQTKAASSLVANDTGAYYAVIYDAATVEGAQHYIVSADKSYTVDAQNKDITVAFGSMTGTTTANYFLNSSWQSVPEPTSGLLLLIGVAGLALKRKHV